MKKKKLNFVCKLPGKKSLDIIKRDNKVVSSAIGRVYDFVFRKAKNCHVYDVDGRKYLDFSAGIAVANAGHTNPKIVEAIRDQAKLSMHAAFPDFYAEKPLEFIEYLLTFVPKSLNKVFLSNSGTESVEAAYKMVRWHSKKKYVIAFNNCFHGRTMGSLSMTNSKPVQRERFNPFLPVKHSHFAYCYRCPFGKNPDSCSLECLDSVEKDVKKVKKDLAGIFFEPIQGEGGYIVPPKEFIKGLREITSKHGVFLCADEVQTGCFRTGTFLASQGFNIVPDVVSMSKAIGGGIPIGATIASEKLNKWPSGAHSNTFGGNLMATAAGIASLKFMRDKKLGENAIKVGNFIMKRLKEMQEDINLIGDVRGRGLMIGVELVKDRKTKKHAVDERHKILCDASSKGLILLPAGKSAIRICPPLTLTKKQADHGLNIFESSLRSV